MIARWRQDRNNPHWVREGKEVVCSCNSPEAAVLIVEAVNLFAAMKDALHLAAIKPE